MYKKLHELKVPRYQGPFFPEEVEQLTKLWEIIWNIDETLSGCVPSIRELVRTIEGWVYKIGDIFAEDIFSKVCEGKKCTRWQSSQLFQTPTGKIVIFFPWVTDGREKKKSAHRSIAVYTKGKVSEKEVKVLLERIQLRLLLRRDKLKAVFQNLTDETI